MGPDEAVYFSLDKKFEEGFRVGIGVSPKFRVGGDELFGRGVECELDG